MAKEWILNSATNRFQYNFSRNVGKVSEEIRKCQPKELGDWEQYYYTNVRPKQHLILGVKTEPAPNEWDRLFNVDRCGNYEMY